jgi:hypothetical protein
MMGVIVSELGIFTDPLESGSDDDILVKEGDLYPDVDTTSTDDAYYGVAGDDGGR